jgi:hypothetical protein
MADPATQRAAGVDAATDGTGPDEVPTYDPRAVDRAYLQERARRRARIERTRAQRRASFRFWFVVLVLLAATVLLSLTIWREIERLFGL